MRDLDTGAEQPAQALGDAAEHFLDLGIRGSGQPKKPYAFNVADEDTTGITQ